MSVMSMGGLVFPTFTEAVCGTSTSTRCVLNSAGAVACTSQGPGAGPLSGPSIACPVEIHTCVNMHKHSSERMIQGRLSWGGGSEDSGGTAKTNSNFGDDTEQKRFPRVCDHARLLGLTMG